MLSRWNVMLAGIMVAFAPAVSCHAQQSPHNVILFVADGLRPGMVNDQTTPALAALMKQGVHFTNTPFHVPYLHYGQCGIDGHRTQGGRHRRLQ
jgi:hypothetical protein